MKEILCVVCGKHVGLAGQHSDLYNLCVTVHTNCLLKTNGEVKPDWLFKDAS